VNGVLAFPGQIKVDRVKTYVDLHPWDSETSFFTVIVLLGTGTNIWHRVACQDNKMELEITIY